MLLAPLAIDLDWGPLGTAELLLRLATATMLGGLIGLERERMERAAGLRTHALVSVASALLMIVSTYGFPARIEGTTVVLDPSRLAAQVVSGIGFLGAGVIIFRENTVRGLTTAATVWAVAGVGLAAGGGLYLAAIAGTAFMLFIQAGLKPVERKLFAREPVRHRLILEIEHEANLLSIVQAEIKDAPVRLRSFQLERAPASGLDLVELSLRAERQRDVLDLVARLQTLPWVHRITYQRGASLMPAVRRGSDGSEDDESERER
jgi:putative Mg2+ transporter-C (MgtC) family protein